MSKLKTEFFVGLFVLIGAISATGIYFKMGSMPWQDTIDHYQISARFSSISGLKRGAAVEVAGVKLGSVVEISFDEKKYEAKVLLSLPKRLQLPTDSIASIRTNGLIGDKYIKITPGGDEEMMKEHDEFEQTESSLDVEELLSKFIFNAEKDA